MRKITIFLFLLSSTLAVYNPYENASSSDYQSLYAEVRTSVIKVVIANRKRKEKVRFPGRFISCKNKCGKQRSHTFYCHCDEICQLAQDCCYDYLKICKPNTTTSQFERKRWQCISDVHHQHLNYIPWYDVYVVNMLAIKGHLMISSCLNCSLEFQEKCSNPLSDIHMETMPVEGPDGHTYKNKFCALGNGIEPENLKYWGYEMFCGKVKAYNETEKIHAAVNKCVKNENQICPAQDKAFLLNNCSWYYKPSWNITKSHTVCSPVKTCLNSPSTNMTLKLKCDAYMLVVYHNGTFYKNFHCAKCYGIKPVELQNSPIVTFSTISIFFKTPQNKPNRHKKTDIKYDTNRTAGTVNHSSNSVNHSSNSFEAAKSELEVYFNLVGFSISIVTLLFLLVLYSLVPELRTTPGKIIIGLSTSTLMYQIVLLVSPQFTENAVACSITAIILHFSILLSFAWMSIMGFDVWKTFGRNNQQPMRKTSSSFLYYCLYVFINPLIIVLTAIALDRSGVMSVYWRNGKSNSCWIVNNLSSILFFKLPVGIVLSLNVAAFIWTIVGITNVRNKTIKYNNSTKNQQTTILKDMKMYGKLSVVMGLTWIFGFAVEYSVIVNFLFLIFNSLQGFFIFLAFVTNKRVVEKCKVSRRSWISSQSASLNSRKISSGSTGSNTRKFSRGNNLEK